MKRMVLLALSLFLFSGCAAKFACKGNPNAPGCHSVSGMYDIINKKDVRQDSETPEGYPEIIQPGTPMRDNSRLLRVWVAPWVDQDDDYHDQSYLYLVLNHGRWFIDRERKQIEARYAPRIMPPKAKVQGQAGNTQNVQPSPRSQDTNISSQVLK